MGGHGGLNILPQKSWNVYGRKNRLKVSQDEEAEAARLAAERSKAEHLEREARLSQLKHEGGATEVAPRAVQHINFWQDWESNAANEAIEEAKKDERRKRGDLATQTSDARFDEGFRMMHGISGPAPWYARPKHLDDAEPAPAARASAKRGAPAFVAAAGQACSSLSASEGAGASGRGDAAEPRAETCVARAYPAAPAALREEAAAPGGAQKRQKSDLAEHEVERGRPSAPASPRDGTHGGRCASPASAGDARGHDGGGRDERCERKRKDKMRKRSPKEKSHKRRKERTRDAEGSAGRKSIDVLRAERLQREAAEAARTHGLLRNAFR